MANYIQQLKERAELAEQERQDAFDALRECQDKLAVAEAEIRDHVCIARRKNKATYKDGVWHF